MSYYRTLGDVVNYAFLVLNVVITSIAMLGLPDASAYDSWWTENGFCVNQAPPDPATGRRLHLHLDTEILCCLVLVTSAIVTHLFLQKSKSTKTSPLNSSSSSNQQLLLLRMQGGVLANAAHGLGHLFVYYSPGPPPAISLHWKDDPMALANIIMLLCFWVGVLRAVVLSISHYGTAVMLAVAILTAQYLLNVPPNLSFTFSQSVIFLAGSIDQLILVRQRQQRQQQPTRKPQQQSSKGEDDNFCYALIALSFLPNMFLYALEMTYCTKILAPIGGHAIYDTYLSVQPFLLYFAVQLHETNTARKLKKR